MLAVTFISRWQMLAIISKRKRNKVRKPSLKIKPNKSNSERSYLKRDQLLCATM